MLAQCINYLLKPTIYITMVGIYLEVMLFVVLVVSLQTPVGLNLQSETPDIRTGNSTHQATGLKKSVNNRDEDNNRNSGR